MSDSNPQEQNRETETKTFLDLKLNPNFATNQQTDNLEKLKKSVHHLLSVKFIPFLPFCNFAKEFKYFP